MRQYETYELSYTAPAPEGSEAAADLCAVFSHQGKSVSVKGFYAGNDTYKVRFLPMDAGEYTYEVSGAVTDSGTLTFKPAVSHGPVRADGFHFRYADGTSYRPFGTTVYALAHQEEWIMEQTFESLAGAPFNKVRLCLFPKHYEHNHNEPSLYAFEKDADGNWDVNHPCFAFWDAFEDKLQKLEALGIQADLILFHNYDRWGFATLGQKNSLIYLDYLLRRFAAYPHIWWSLANEYDLVPDRSIEDWEEIEEFVAKNDPYHHLISNHNCFAFWDHSRPNITHASLQTKMLTRIEEWREKYQKPVIVDECCYEGNIAQYWGSITAFEMAARFWKVMTIGGYCTHGETYLDPENDVLWWARGGKLKGQSPKRIAFLKEVMESLPGPVDPDGGFSGMLWKAAMSPDKEELLKDADPRFAQFVRVAGRLGSEAVMFRGAEFEYRGRCGDDAFLVFYDQRPCAEDTLHLPENRAYRVDLIDIWNMTRKVLLEHASGETKLELPGTIGMAVIAVAEDL